MKTKIVNFPDIFPNATGELYFKTEPQISKAAQKVHDNFFLYCFI